MARRCNFGAGLCPARGLLFLDDDELAPPDLADRALAELAKKPFAIGQYRNTKAIRYQDPPASGLVPVYPPDGAWTWREALVPTHTFLSSYGGCLAVERGLFYALGGFDEIFLGTRGTYDQDFALRAARALGLDPYRIPFSHDLWVWHDLASRQEADGSPPQGEAGCPACRLESEGGGSRDPAEDVNAEVGTRIAELKDRRLSAADSHSAFRVPSSVLEIVPGVRLRRCPRCGFQSLSDNHQLLQWRIASGMNLSFLGPRRDPLRLD
jgi:hypothetical protein